MKRCLPLAAILLLPLPCWSQSDPPELPPASTKTGVTYAADIRPIFEENCFRCHGPKKDRGDLRLDSLEAVLKGGEDGKVVVPGNSARSSLVSAVARVDKESAMPPIRKSSAGGPAGASKATARPLTAEEVGLIRAWIDQGAK